MNNERRMARIVEEKCMARVWRDGDGGRCRNNAAPGDDLCGVHSGPATGAGAIKAGCKKKVEHCGR